jgi:hypothetical protein
VTVLIPNQKISARWNGALQARLRYAPLERFLRSQGLKWIATGETRITDNLATATIRLVGEALSACDAQSPLFQAPLCHAAVGQSACAVSSAVALLIQEPNYWRTGSLVATARLLENAIGLSAAAHLAAAAARDYSLAINNGTLDPHVIHIGRLARAAVEDNSPEDIAHTVRLITQRLLAAPSKPPRLRAPKAGDPTVACERGGVNFM